MGTAETIEGVLIVDSSRSTVTKSWIESLLRAWSQSIDDYAERSKGQTWPNKRKANHKKGDAAYWYGERVDVGIFSAAATKLGLMTLLELPHIKRRRRLRHLSETRKHRIDLTTFDISNSMSMWEFKRKAVRLAQDMDASSTMTALVARVKEAETVLLKRTKDEDIHRWAGAFVPIWLVRSASDIENAELSKFVKSLIKSAKSTKLTAIAWVFPAATRKLYWEYGKKNAKKRKYWPGVVFAMKSIESSESD